MKPSSTGLEILTKSLEESKTQKGSLVLSSQYIKAYAQHQPSLNSPFTNRHSLRKMEATSATSYRSKSKLSKIPFQESFKNHDSSWQNNKKKNQVFLQGYINEEEEGLVRAKSLTDEDLEELKGCLDLGFGFSYHEIPELCNTLPALELCYSMSRNFIDDQHKSPENESLPAGKANWKISSPGDDPEDVKARLKFWAQAVACTVKLCS